MPSKERKEFATLQLPRYHVITIDGAPGAMTKEVAEVVHGALKLDRFVLLDGNLAMAHVANGIKLMGQGAGPRFAENLAFSLKNGALKLASRAGAFRNSSLGPLDYSLSFLTAPVIWRICEKQIELRRKFPLVTYGVGQGSFFREEADLIAARTYRYYLDQEVSARIVLSKRRTGDRLTVDQVAEHLRRCEDRTKWAFNNYPAGPGGEDVVRISTYAKSVTLVAGMILADYNQRKDPTPLK